MIADVAQAGRPQQGVDDGVREDVPVRGGNDTVAFVDHHAAENNRRSPPDPMDIDPERDSDGRKAHASASSSSSTTGKARSSLFTASSSSTSREKANSLVRVSRAFDSILFNAGEIPLVC